MHNIKMECLVVVKQGTLTSKYIDWREIKWLQLDVFSLMMM